MTPTHTEDSASRLVYAPIPRTGWDFISCVSYDHITADAAQINQETIQLTMFHHCADAGHVSGDCNMLVFVVRASTSRKLCAATVFSPDDPLYVPNVIVMTQCERRYWYASRNTEQVLGIEGWTKCYRDKFFKLSAAATARQSWTS